MTCIKIHPCPADDITIKLVVRPTRGCCEIAECYMMYYDWIEDRADATLSAMGKEMWGDPNNARFKMQDTDAQLRSFTVTHTRKMQCKVTSAEGGHVI